MDLYLKAPTEADMNAALIAAGLAYEADGALYPAQGASLDIIGPFTRTDYSVEPPVETVHPEWHVNVRCAGLSEEALADLAAVMIVPPETPYRVWA